MNYAKYMVYISRMIECTKRKQNTLVNHFEDERMHKNKTEQRCEGTQLRVKFYYSSRKAEKYCSVCVEIW